MPDATQIDKQTVLFAKHDSENYLGLAILLPDWQRSGQLWQLTRQLTRVGFDTLLLLPSPTLSPLPALGAIGVSVIDHGHKLPVALTGAAVMLAGIYLWAMEGNEGGIPSNCPPFLPMTCIIAMKVPRYI